MRFHKYILLAFAALVFISCDTINEPYVKDFSQGNGDTSEIKRKILLEDYTGFRCGNCPEAAEQAHHLQQAYGEQLIMMAVHAGPFARPLPSHPYDFRTEVGTTFDDFFKISNSGNPNGMVNRVEQSGSRIISPGGWEQAIIDELEREPEVNITLAPEYDHVNFGITVSATITYLKPGSSNHNISLMLIENNFKQFQVDDRADPPEIEDFNHMHVLRDALNGTWGTQIHDGQISANDTFTKEIKYTIKPENRAGGEYPWNPDELHIIAYVHDYQQSYRILQAEEVKLIK